MPKISTVLYSTKQGISNIRRNRMFSLASIGTMTACLFLFGIFYFILANFQHMVKSAETTVGISVFFDKGLTEDDIFYLGQEIENRSEVDQIQYISADEAWENYKEKYISQSMAESFGDDNPLKDSASYVIYLKETALQESFVQYLEELDGVRQVNDSKQIASIFEGVNQAAGYISGAVITVLLCVAAFLISTTVTMGISVRRQEISIMKLIGASDFFIRAPFIVEGILIGAMGAVIPLVFLYFIYQRIIQFLMNGFTSGIGSTDFAQSSAIFSVLTPVSFGIGIGIGFLGSYVTVRRQLKKIRA